jgi:hypothetical protein
MLGSKENLALQLSFDFFFPASHVIYKKGKLKDD